MIRFSSRSAALAGVFAALHAMLYAASFDLWRNWSIYLMPLEGIILGPWVGLTAAFAGSVAGRAIKPTSFWMFGIIAEPMGVLACGFLARRQWKPLVAVYSIMLASFFANPIGRELPLWTILDILFAFVLIFPVTRMFRILSEADGKHLILAVVLISFVGIATDALTRVFLFVPAGLYTLLMPAEWVYPTFIAGAIDSYIEDALVVVFSILIGCPVLLALKRIAGIKYPLS